MKRLIALALILVALFFVSPTNAILTSNSQNKSTIPDEQEQQVAEESSAAIDAVASAVLAIEKNDDLAAGQDQLGPALESLGVVEKILSEFIPVAKTDPLTLADVSITGNDILKLINPQDVEIFLRSHIQPWPPSEQKVLEFLLEETKKAQTAVELMQSGIAKQDAERVRLGSLAFYRFPFAAGAYSLLWSWSVVE